jgi:phytoene dehydrogenase-like protein
VKTQAKQIVIVGAGLGGLFSAAYLSQLGFKVTLLESHNKLGGLATWYYRLDRKYLFSVSPHIVPKSLSKYLRQAFGSELSDELIPYPQIYFHKLNHACSFKKSDYPKYLSSYLSSQDLERVFSPTERTIDLSIEDYLNQRIENKESFYNLIYLPLSHAKGLSLTSSIQTFYQTLDLFLEDGCFGFKNPIDVLMKKIKTHLEAHGVEIKMNKKVEHIQKIQHHFKIQTASEIFSADVVLWGATPQIVFNDLYPEANFKDLSLTKTVSLNQVAMGIRGVKNLSQHTLFLNKTEDSLEGYFHFNSDFSSLIYSSLDKSTDWKNLDEETYQLRKTALILHAQKLVHQFYGQLDIEFTEVSSPKTVEAYTHHYRGAIFGHKSDLDQYLSALEANYPGLYFVGARGEDFSGWLGMAKLAKLTANRCQNFLMEGTL